MDEMMLGDKLEHFRGMAKSYVGPSFAPIVGYQDHGAIVHYSATKESCYDVLPLYVYLLIPADIIWRVQPILPDNQSWNCYG